MNNKKSLFCIFIAVLSLFLLQFFVGCTTSKTKDFLPTPPDIEDSNIWSKFKNKQSYKINNQKAFLVKGSMDISTPEENRRMNFTFWGNFSYPLRIDMQAGFGTTFALWRISEQKWKAYFPGQNTAYTHSDPVQGTARLGFPIPFSFKKLALILNGYWKEIIPDDYSKAKYITNRNCWEFYFQSHNIIHSLKLDKNAYPIEIKGKLPYNWTVSLKKYFQNKNQAIPRRLVLDINQKYQSTITIKDKESRTQNWPIQSLELNLPENTETMSLKQKRR